MAFRFQWPYFSEEFIQEAKTMLTNALNKGNKPAVIVDHITVKELDMGTLPPELEMLEMGELSMERFRGIFKLTYNGDAHIVLQTKVQANPMNVKKTDNPSYTRRGILAADQPLVVPMLLRISDFKLRGIIVLVVDQIKGITLVFKNDPLESVLVSSTFDSITPIQRFLQSEIEKQLRNLFQEDLPTAIHNLSQQFTKKPEDVSRQHSQDDLQARPGIYDGGLGTPMISRNPSRRSSMLPGAKKIPGRTSSEPDLSMGVHYDEDGLKPVRKPASATVRSESPGSGSRRDPHTEYTSDAQRDLLEESRCHYINTPLERTSQQASRRSSRASQQHEAGMSGPSTQDRFSLRGEDPFQPSLGIAESTHLANQFANLIHSNQTISPYAQNLEHFTFRSVPPKRPASVQYFGHDSVHRTLSPASKSGPNTIQGANLLNDDGSVKSRGPGYPSGYGQSSPRISHRRLQRRVGIRRYAMQLGAGNGPRELSDQDSDEYNDVDEALSESEYVHIEKPLRQSDEGGRLGKQEDLEYSGHSLSRSPSISSASLQTIDGSSTSPSRNSKPVSSLSQLTHRYPFKENMDPYYESGSMATSTMPGGFSTAVDPRSWTEPKAKVPAEENDSPRRQMLPPEVALQRGLAEMQLNSNSKQQQQSSPPSTKPIPLSPAQVNGHLFKGASNTGMTVAASTTARTFSNTQRYSQPSPRLPPPAPLKRDKRNSSILSSRRVSSVGIGLGVLSKEGDKRSKPVLTQQQQQQQQTLPQQNSTRPSLYQKPFLGHS
ncbi:ERMES complex subunit [Mortierella sp. GBA30]|nr:ERMES complex subunit [Mortierella sp. GBA30]